MKTNYRKIIKTKTKIKIVFLNEENEKEGNPTKVLPKRTIPVLNKAAIQKLASKDRAKSTVEWVKKQQEIKQFENYERVKYPETSTQMAVSNSDNLSQSSHSEEYTTYAVMMMLLATCSLLRNLF